MTRRQRIDHPGAWHHVLNRGGSRRQIYRDDLDRQVFLDLLGKAEIDVHGYALMGNHYHLIVQTGDKPLADVMRDLGREYSTHFNARHGTDGPLCKGRFRSIYVDADSYLLALVRYVHRNPVEAGMVEAAEEYEWSSCRSYVGHVRAPAWLHMDVTLEMVGGTRQLLRLLGSANKTADRVRNTVERPRPPRVLGDESFEASGVAQMTQNGPRLVA